MSKSDELANIIRLHGDWLASGNKSGKRADLSGASLDGVLLANYDLSGAIFRGASLRNSDLSMSTLIHADFNDADLTGANLRGTCLALADFTGADLKNADLSQSALPNNKRPDSVKRGPRFKDSSLVNADLTRCFCFASDFEGANLQQARLPGANLEGANLAGNDLSELDFFGANLHRANLQNSSFQAASLREACLTEANMQRSNLTCADLRQADLRATNMTHSKVDGIIYSRKTQFRGIRLEGCYGSSRFKRNAEDQDYIEEFKEAHPYYYGIWMGLTDCGRSMIRVIAWSLCLSVLFGLLYYSLGSSAFQINSEDGLQWNLFTALYYSVVTFTTLGFGDITPRTHLAAGIVMIEVVIGYIMLGILISILATKVARRS